MTQLDFCSSVLPTSPKTARKLMDLGVKRTLSHLLVPLLLAAGWLLPASAARAEFVPSQAPAELSFLDDASVGPLLQPGPSNLSGSWSAGATNPAEDPVQLLLQRLQYGFHALADQAGMTSTQQWEQAPSSAAGSLGSAVPLPVPDDTGQLRIQSAYQLPAPLASSFFRPPRLG